MQNNQFLKVQNSLLDLEKDFMELKDRELKYRKEKIKKEIEKLFHKPIIMFKDDMHKFQKPEMKKIRPVIIDWFDGLIKQNVMGKKPKIIRDKLKDKTISYIQKPFETEEQKEDRRKRSKMKMQLMIK